MADGRECAPPGGRGPTDTAAGVGAAIGAPKGGPIAIKSGAAWAATLRQYRNGCGGSVSAAPPGRPCPPRPYGAEWGAGPPRDEGIRSGGVSLRRRQPRRRGRVTQLTTARRGTQMGSLCGALSGFSRQGGAVATAARRGPRGRARPLWGPKVARRADCAVVCGGRARSARGGRQPP